MPSSRLDCPLSLKNPNMVNPGKNRPKRQKQSQVARKPRVNAGKIAEVKTWLERMQVNAARTVRLTEHISFDDDVNESNDSFWALAKYTENVQESIVKLDAINKNIFPSLIELDEDIWKGLKGMRSRLAHAFWTIDPQILWSTATKDLPNLLALLSSIIIIDRPVSDGEEIGFVFKTQRLLGLPEVTQETLAKAGHSILALYFFHDGKVGVFRVGHQGSKKLVVHYNFNTKVSVYGRKMESA